MCGVCACRTCAVYHVGENGWTKVWSGDVNEQYYKYYPIDIPAVEDAMAVEGAEEAKGK